jgi:hypothetical protein
VSKLKRQNEASGPFLPWLSSLKTPLSPRPSAQGQRSHPQPQITLADSRIVLSLRIRRHHRDDAHTHGGWAGRMTGRRCEAQLLGQLEAGRATQRASGLPRQPLGFCLGRGSWRQQKHPRWRTSVAMAHEGSVSFSSTGGAPELGLASKIRVGNTRPDPRLPGLQNDQGSHVGTWAESLHLHLVPQALLTLGF